MVAQLVSAVENDLSDYSSIVLLFRAAAACMTSPRVIVGEASATVTCNYSELPAGDNEVQAGVATVELCSVLACIVGLLIPRTSHGTPRVYAKHFELIVG